jgi:SAM-dependent methyltransferase
MSLEQALSVARTWNLVAHGYAAEIAPTFARFAEDALDRAAIAPGERVLDVATGPGTLALAAAARGARVSAIDFSPEMIAELCDAIRRTSSTKIDAHVADARALPFASSEFDAVFAMFALNLMCDRGKALREILRVLKPNGRAVFATPTTMPRLAVFQEIRAIIRRAIPELDIQLALPLSEPEELEREVRAAGFSQVIVEIDQRAFAFPSIDALWDIATRAGAPLVLARESMSADAWDSAAEEIVAALKRRFGEGPQSLEVAVNLAIARP